MYRTVAHTPSAMGATSESLCASVQQKKEEKGHGGGRVEVGLRSAMGWSALHPWLFHPGHTILLYCRVLQDEKPTHSARVSVDTTQ